MYVHMQIVTEWRVHLSLYYNSHQLKADFAMRIDCWFSLNKCKDLASRHTSFGYVRTNRACSTDIYCSKANGRKYPVQRQCQQTSNKVSTSQFVPKIGETFISLKQARNQACMSLLSHSNFVLRHPCHLSLYIFCKCIKLSYHLKAHSGQPTFNQFRQYLSYSMLVVEEWQKVILKFCLQESSRIWDK